MSRVKPTSESDLDICLLRRLKTVGVVHSKIKVIMAVTPMNKTKAIRSQTGQPLP